MAMCDYAGMARFTHDGKPIDNPELDKYSGPLLDYKLQSNEQKFGRFPASGLVG